MPQNFFVISLFIYLLPIPTHHATIELSIILGYFASPIILYEWSHTECIFFCCLSSFIQHNYFDNHSFHLIIIHSILFLSNIPLYRYHYLFIYQSSVDKISGWFPIWGYYIQGCCEHLRPTCFLYGHMLSFLLNKHLGTESLDYIGRCLI